MFNKSFTSYLLLVSFSNYGNGIRTLNHRNERTVRWPPDRTHRGPIFQSICLFVCEDGRIEWWGEAKPKSTFANFASGQSTKNRAKKVTEIPKCWIIYRAISMVLLSKTLWPLSWLSRSMHKWNGNGSGSWVCSNDGKATFRLALISALTNSWCTLERRRWTTTSAPW